MVVGSPRFISSPFRHLPHLKERYIKLPFFSIKSQPSRDSPSPVFLFLEKKVFIKLIDAEGRVFEPLEECGDHWI
jgi:hypothetical protein